MASKSIKKNKATKVTAKVNKNLRNHDNDPYVVAMTERAMATLKKYGLPEAFKRKNK